MDIPVLSELPDGFLATLGILGVILILNRDKGRIRSLGVVLAALAIGLLAAPQQIVVQPTVVREPKAPQVELDCEVTITTDTTHDTREEENALGQLEQLNRQKGCTVETKNSAEPRSAPSPFPEEGRT